MRMGCDSSGDTAMREAVEVDVLDVDVVEVETEAALVEVGTVDNGSGTEEEDARDMSTLSVWRSLVAR